MNSKLTLVFMLMIYVFISTSVSQNVSFELLQKYHHNSADWNYNLNAYSTLGTSAPLGDLDKDGNDDILLGAYGEGTESGSGEVLVAFLKQDGSIREIVKIAAGTNGFNESLVSGTYFVYDGSRFGESLTTIGDLDNDGIQDIAVGAYEDYSSISNERCGSVYILMMNSDGTVKSHQRIGEGEGGLTGWGPQAHLGSSLTAIGDADNDGIPDIAIGSQGDRDLGANGGAVFIAYLNRNGTVKSQKKIIPTGSFFSEYSVGDRFGCTIDNIGDINGDGNFDLLVGSVGSKSWLLFLDENQNVIGTKVYDLNHSSIQSIFSDAITFGVVVSSTPDINYDGRNELLLSSFRTTSGYGEVALVFIDEAGDITGYKLLNKDVNGLGIIKDEDFGSKLSYLGDLNKDGFPEIGVGSIYHSGEVERGGAVYTISLIPGPCIEDECLWPGDCNNDGIVNCKDIIPIGSSFLETDLEARRILPTIDWMVQYAGDWENEKWKINKKFSDCNGDGIIDLKDKDAIYANYGFSQQKMLDEVELNPDGPLLNLVAVQNSITPGDTARFDLYFGESNKEAEKIYGISFSLGHEITELFGITKNTAEFPTSWLGEEGTDLITMYVETSDGIDVSLVRTDKKNRSGFGKIASIDIVTPDNLVEKIEDVLKLSLKDVLIVSYEEDTIFPDFKSDAIEMNDFVNVKSVFNHLKIYPNPIDNLINVEMHEKIESIKVLDLHGREILIAKPNTNHFTVNISHLSKGKYFLIANSSSNRYLTRIAKQ